MDGLDVRQEKHNFQMVTTPELITPEIRALCQRLGCVEDPAYVPVHTRNGAERNDCFNVVAEHCKEQGGTSVIGWQIWEWSGVLIEAEFHAVWRAPDGQIIDISFKPDGESRVLFVADPVRTYNGHKIDNVRAAVWDNPLVHEFIRVNEEFQQEIINRHGADYLGEVQVTGRLAELYRVKRALPFQIAETFVKQRKDAEQDAPSNGG